jgi:endonuclease G
MNYENISVDSLHTHFGIPYDDDLSDDYYVEREEYFVSYNPILNTPNFVCWNLNIEWFGEAERFDGKWKFDPLLPASFKEIDHITFTNSGYDRGHIVRSEERTRNDEDNENTFYNTNLMPQTADLNRGVWLDFERYYEDLVKDQNKELYIISGGIYTSGTKIKDITHVPDSCWKVVVVLERKELRSNVTVNTQVKAVNMPNIDGIRSDD